MRGHGGELTGLEPGLFLQSTGHGWRGQRGPAAPPGAPWPCPGDEAGRQAFPLVSPLPGVPSSAKRF